MAEVKTATIESFQFQGACVECIPYGSGHINDTFRVTCDDNGTTRRYILQRMNKNIFLNPEELMENVVGVTSWLNKKIQENGGDPERETLKQTLLFGAVNFMRLGTLLRCGFSRIFP